MFVVLVEFRLYSEFGDFFRERVMRQAADSLALEAECHQFDVCIDPNQPDDLLLYEIYSDRAAFDTHLASAHFVQFDADVKHCIEQKTVRTFERLESVNR